MTNKRHPAEAYIEGVLDGSIPACYEVRQAYQRHQDDLELCREKGLVFNPNYSQQVINLFTKLKHYKGDYAGKPVYLEPWQQAIIWVTYGWRRGHKHGPRRFRQVYFEVPKKNGKTTMLAGLGIYHFAFDGESGAEVYTAATKRDQAKLCFNDIKAMIKTQPELAREFGIHTSTIFWERNHSKIVPLSRDSNTADGFNPSAAIIDELHRHQDGSMVGLLANSMATRSQGITFEITTAGTDKQSVCYKHRQYTIDVNAGRFQDESWWGLVYTLDEDDDWREPAAWRKANPNLGTGKSEEYMAELIQKARNDPSQENEVKRYHFNLWTGTEDKWITEERWQQGVPEEPIAEELLLEPEVEVYGGLDLAATSDFNALALTFHHPLEGWLHQKYFFWIPGDALDRRVEKQNMDFRQWVRAGYVRELPGNVIDQDLLAEEIAQICTKYQVKSLAYDRYLAYNGAIQALIRAGISTTEQQQSMIHMSYPTKELERLVLSGHMTHENNPVMSWMMGNVMIYRDANDNIKIQKAKSVEKVDGPVAAVMSIAEYLAHNISEEESPYNEAGFF